MPLPSKTFPGMVCRVALLIASALLAVGSFTAEVFSGEVVVVGDDWPLSDFAFDQNPTASQQLAATLANFFTGSTNGNFLVVSDAVPIIPFGKPGLTGDALAQAMQSLGHNWVIDPAADFTFANLSQYDGLFLSGSLGSGPTHATILRQYVLAGGGVFLAGGTGDFGTAADEALAWAPFLSEFGLALGPTWFGGTAGAITSVPAIEVTPPPGSGVTSIAWSQGQLATVTNPSNPRTRIALRGDFQRPGQRPPRKRQRCHGRV